jgi:flagellar basal body P-ring formation protein FlgA
MRRMILAAGWCCLLVMGVRGESLSQAVTDRIMVEYGYDSASVIVAVARLEPEMADVAGYEVKVLPQIAGAPRGRCAVKIELYRQGELVQRGSATVDVRMHADLLVPTRTINRGEALTPVLFTTKRFDVTSWTEPMLADPTHLAGCRAKNMLVAGRQVGLARIERIPDVLNGGTVTLVGTVGTLEIRAKGVALQNGAVGETIAVRNLDSGKVVSGTITAPGAVAIAL